LNLYGDDDQIVPIGASAMLSLKLIEDAALETYKGAPRFGSSRLGSRPTAAQTMKGDCK